MINQEDLGHYEKSIEEKKESLIEGHGSNLSYYGIKIQEVPDFTNPKKTTINQHLAAPFVELQTSNEIMSYTPNFDRPQSNQSLRAGQQSSQLVERASKLSSTEQENKSQVMSDETIEDHSENLLSFIKDKIVEELYLSAVDYFKNNLYDQIINMICSTAEEIIIGQLLNQYMSICDTDATLEQITERERLSSKSLIQRKEQMQTPLRKILD